MTLSADDYERSELVRAGKALGGDLIWTPDKEDEINRIFAIAHHWRESHAKPMSSVRAGVDGCRRSMKLDGITVSRLKRMHSIRKKLSRTNLRLHKIQDLGGCRSVLTTMAAVKKLADGYRDRTPHELVREVDYIENPKSSGYRCRHLIFQYSSDNAETNGRRIEVQIRTRLQHSWATAVEVVGTYRREDLKAEIGDPDWLRLFVLMAGEIARCEGSALPNGCPSKEGTVAELIALDNNLNAIDTLESIRFAFSGTDRLHINRNAKPEFYLIQFDRETRQVKVRGYDKSSDGARQYNEAEASDQRSNTYRYNTVLIGADAIESMKIAFPNYFGDVQLFTEMLKRVVKGEDVQEWRLPPQQLAPREPDERPDMSWFRQHRFRKWF